MKYRIKWPWAGAEQIAVVYNGDGAKPVAALYFHDNNGRTNKADYVLLHEGEVITGSCRAIGLTSCVAIGDDWVMKITHDGCYTLKYKHINMLEWKVTDEHINFDGLLRLADWYLNRQLELQEWQIESLVGSYEALNYLKASIEHE